MIEQAFRIGSFANIPVRIHWTFLLLILYIIGTGLYDKVEWSGILMLVGFTLCLFICVVLHEFGHALTAKKFGVKTADIILLPIGGVARLMNLPDKPAHELWIAIMGPVVNLVIASLIFIGLYIGYGSGMKDLFLIEFNPYMNVGESFAYLLEANVILMVFNMVPAFPMDGGRVLRALLSMKTSRLVATKWASRIGQAACVIFIILGFLLKTWTLVLIGAFIFFGASQEYQHVKREFKYKNKLLKDYFRRITLHVPEYTFLREIIDEIRLSGVRQVPVVNLQGQISGTLSAQILIQNADQLKDKTAKEIMNTEVIYLSSSTDILQALYYLESGVPAVYLTENSNVIGIIDLECIKVGIG